ncbi:ATP-binding protein [Actinocorallia lasiicapitis]
MAEGTVGGRLAGARRRRFVGRGEEIGLFRRALSGAEPRFVVLFVHGAGGVGKTALLGELARVAAEAGAVPVRVDGRNVDPIPDLFHAAVKPPERGRAVLLIDTYESIRPLDGWIRETLIPGLPSDTIVVIAGREPPGPGWYADPAWRDLLEIVTLSDLSTREVRAYARTEGLPETVHERLAQVTHGHPLALVLLTEALRRNPSAGLDLADTPDVVGRLVECFVADAPSARHRRALQACAHARFTTEPLLRAALAEDVEDLFGWLRGLPFVEQGPMGLFPHDLVREVVCADLRWRDPEAFAVLHHRIRDHLIARIQATRELEQHQWVIDAGFLVRANPSARGYWDWTRLGAAYPDVVRAGDHDAIVAMTERHEGPASASLAAHWLRHPGAVAGMFRDPSDDGLGYALLLRLHELDEADMAVDPVVAAAWRYVRAHGPLRPAEEVIMGRFFMDRDRYQGPSATRNAAMARQVQRVLASPNLAFDFICAFTGDGQEITPLLAHIGYQRLPEADGRVGALGHAAFVRDWRGRTPQSWLDMLGERELGLADPTEEPSAPVLSRLDAADAVRLVLRDLCAPDRLAASPLLRCRIVKNADPAALRELLRQAVLDLADDPRAERAGRVLDRTFLHPARTQELAAEALGLPFSTYRRHLAKGLERVVELLWDREFTATRNGQ